MKSRFIIYFALNKLFYTHNRSKDTDHFLILCARSFRKCTERGGSNPEWTASLCIFAVPALCISSVIKMGEELLSRRNSRFESFVRTNLPCLHGTIGGSLNISLSNNSVFLGEHFTRVVLSEDIGLRGFRCYPRVICRVDTTAFAWSYLAHVYCKICYKLSKY